MNTTIKSICDNLCHTCVFAVPQEGDVSLGLVNCPKKGYGNASSSTIHPCEDYMANDRLIRLEDAAVEAIKDFNTLNALHVGTRHAISDYQQRELDRAASKACAMTEAYSLIRGIGYDTAAEILNSKAANHSEIGE
ncbi:MAG: hypothetical protein FWB96_01490 [Defluviitaleaceae bacterium]|nr:hypothetical protein [Defluviitaleaceae bacterium]MCL2261633.1 hypothetical protein [Defluviitaleaceae bacterium]